MPALMLIVGTEADTTELLLRSRVAGDALTVREGGAARDTPKLVVESAWDAEAETVTEGTIAATELKVTV